MSFGEFVIVYQINTPNATIHPITPARERYPLLDVSLYSLKLDQFTAVKIIKNPVPIVAILVKSKRFATISVTAVVIIKPSIGLFLIFF